MKRLLLLAPLIITISSSFFAFGPLIIIISTFAEARSFIKLEKINPIVWSHKKSEHIPSLNFFLMDRLLSCSTLLKDLFTIPLTFDNELARSSRIDLSSK